MSLLSLEKIFVAVITLALGITLILVDGSLLATVIFIVLGALILICNFVPFIESIKNLKYKNKVAISQFINALIIIIVGILLIFFQRRITYLIGATLIIMGIVNVFLNKNHWRNELKYQLPFIIIGILLVSVGFGGILNFILAAIGYILVIISISYFIVLIVRYFKKHHI